MTTLLALMLASGSAHAVEPRPDDPPAEAAKGPKKTKGGARKPPTPTAAPRPAPVPTSVPKARPTEPSARPAPANPRPMTAPPPRTDVVRTPKAPASATETQRTSIRPAPRPVDATRSFEPRKVTPTPVAPTVARPSPLSRPDVVGLGRPPRAPAPPPRVWSYRPWYAHWYVHPYYRHLHVSWCVVAFPFAVAAWDPIWAPPPRMGWVWVPGYWAWSYWHPGYWVPTAPAPVHAHVRYVWVPGWWSYEHVYVEGWWRTETRDAWEWVEGYYLDDGTYVSGYWRPTDSGPEGYVWEPGFFDGKDWIDGYWRPEFVDGFRWASAYFDEDGVRHSGYWEPTEPVEGQVWIPGWFDGNQWIKGYWVTDEEYESADVDGYDPEAAEPVEPLEVIEGEPPLAIPVAQ